MTRLEKLKEIYPQFLTFCDDTIVSCYCANKFGLADRCPQQVYIYGKCAICWNQKVNEE